MYDHVENKKGEQVPALHGKTPVIVLEEGDWIYRRDCWWVVQDLLPEYVIEVGGDDFWGGIGCAREFHDPPAGTQYLDRTDGAQIKVWQ